MYEEPYRWVEAIGNRRQYLDEQLKQGSPVVALSYADGALLLTVSRGTPKLYEIYDRIGLGGIGHPADLEKLRFSLLEMAHLEGFNRSPSDVTGARMMKLGLAPIIKQAFEEIFKAPFIVKILLAELSLKPGKDTFLTIDYDGTFEETSGCAVLAATKTIEARMVGYLKQAGHAPTLSLDAALALAAKAWAVGSLAQAAETETDRKDEKESNTPVAKEPEDAALLAHLRETLADKTLEGAVLERQAPGSSKYRVLTREELASLVPKSAPAST
ncbi:MAG: proteasome subunit alpha [Nitrospira sp.]|nr:proteasome subunit alpha [Nitrospira sp.]